MKSIVALLVLVAAMPLLILIALLGHPFLAVLLMFGAIAANATAMVHEAEHGEPPRCETCGQVIEEGADMALEDEFLDEK